MVHREDQTWQVVVTLLVAFTQYHSALTDNITMAQQDYGSYQQ